MMHVTRFWPAVLAALLLMSQGARGDDFASDLAACAKAPIDSASFAFEDGQTAASFTINHSECVPPVVGGDPLLYGLSGLVAVLQNQGTLPKGTQACIDASIGQASKPVAGALDTALGKTGLSSLLPAEGRTMLKDIAHGQSQATLYDVPGVGVVMDKVACSCAVASTGLDIDKLKDRLNKVMASVSGCENVGKKLIAGIYSTGKAVVGAAKGAVNSVGCTFGLGGCDDDEPSGPPFFCVGYDQLRGQGWKHEEVAGIFSGYPFTTDNYSKWLTQALTDCQTARIDAERVAKENKEIEIADKLGSANALGFALRWIKKCSDKVCESGISKMADEYNAEVNDPDTIKFYGSFAVAKTKLDKKYGERAALAIVLSRDRHFKALRANVNAPVVERLPAFDCNPFLGRARWSLCEKQPGFQVCKDYASKGQWDFCAWAKTQRTFAAGEGLDRVLRAGGCIPSSPPMRRPGGPAAPGLTAQCLSASARAGCDSLVKGGSAVKCDGPLLLAFHPGMRIKPKRERDADVPVPVQIRPMRPVEPKEPVRPAAGARPLQPAQTSTICRFTHGRRAGQTQDYAPMAPIPVGSNCHDGQGSTGVVVAP
jgi:hypothetical protein